jgi:hypothetical protein
MQASALRLTQLSKQAPESVLLQHLPNQGYDSRG